MSRLTSISPSTKIEELRDEAAFPVVLYTGLGRNGTRELRLSDQRRQPVDITSMTVKAVVKTGPDALDTELDASFPLTATITNGADGRFELDFAAVDFTARQSRVVIYIYDDSGANPVLLAQGTTIIEKAGV